MTMLYFLVRNLESVDAKIQYFLMLCFDVKDFKALIDNKLFSDQSIKHKQEAYEKIIKMSRNNCYTTGNLLDYLYHQHFG